MRICFVATEYPPGPMGGAGTYTLLMSSLLTQAGHEVTLLTKRLDPKAPEHEDHGALQIYRLPVYYEYTGAAETADDELFCIEMHWVRSFVGIYAREVARKIDQLHRANPFDVVLTQDLEAPTWLLQDRRMLFAEHLELPFVCFIHSPHWQIQQYNEDSRYDRHEYHRYLYEKQSMSQAEGIIASSRYMKRELEEQLGLDPSHVDVIPLPLGGCPPKSSFKDRYSDGNEGRKRLLYSGRIELRKGVEVLLRAVVPLLRDDPDLELHLVGRDMPHPTLGADSTRDKLLNKIIPQGLRDRVVFRGAVPREALWDEFAKATVGVIPSLWEPFSFVCQEMMATGAPVVATRTGGMADMIEDGVSGLLCEPGSVESLAAALRKALYAPAEQRRSWGEAAATRIHQFCDSRLVVDRTVEALERAIERNRRERLELGRVPIPGNLPFGDEPAWQPDRPAMPAPKPISKVGVVVPVYNLGQYLGECLDSIEAQSFRDYMIIVVDDGSTDPDTLDALKAAASRPQVEVSHFTNGGLPVARNRGARIAIEHGCDALVFLDCDDMIRPSYLEKAARVLSLHPEAGAVTAWTESVGLMHTYWAPTHGQFPFMLAECMSTPAAMVRTSAYQAVGGIDEDMKYAYEDWNFWIRLCSAGFPMLMIPEPLLIYRMREGSIAQMYKATTREHGRMHMVAHHEELFRRYAADVVLLQDGLLYREQMKAEKDMQHLKQQNKELREDLDLKIVDITWASKEWRHWKQLYEEEQARHRQTTVRLEELEAAIRNPGR